MLTLYRYHEVEFPLTSRLSSQVLYHISVKEVNYGMRVSYLGVRIGTQGQGESKEKIFFITPLFLNNNCAEEKLCSMMVRIIRASKSDTLDSIARSIKLLLQDFLIGLSLSAPIWKVRRSASWVWLKH